jgi:hypothetical protein
MSVAAVKAVLASRCSSGGHRVVELVLAEHANEHGESWPSVPRIAAEANTSTRSAQRSIRWLQAHGRLQIVEHGAKPKGSAETPWQYRPNLYRLVVTPVASSGDTRGTPVVTPTSSSTTKEPPKNRASASLPSERTAIQAEGKALKERGGATRVLYQAVCQTPRWDQRQDTWVDEMRRPVTPMGLPLGNPEDDLEPF